MSFFRKKPPLLQTAEWMIVGLGNPGAKYSSTRHNCGFIACDTLAKARGIKLDRLKWKALYGIYSLNGTSVAVIKPQTFMNLSGGPVTDAAMHFKIPPERMIVIQDDVDLAPGRIRIKRGGSDGGHNGIKDILYKLQSADFLRVKVGVGRPDGDMAEHVLSPMDRLSRVCAQKAAEAAETIIAEGIEQAMARFNGAVFGCDK